MPSDPTSSTEASSHRESARSARSTRIRSPRTPRPRGAPITDASRSSSVVAKRSAEEHRQRHPQAHQIHRSRLRPRRCATLRLWPLSAGALAVLAPRPAAGPTAAVLELLLRPTNASVSSLALLGVLDPANELVAGKRRDVVPGGERRRRWRPAPCASRREAHAPPHPARPLVGCSPGLW